MVDVRFAVQEDLDSVIKLHQRAWQDAYKDVMPEERLREGTEDLMRSRWEPAFAAQSPPERSVLVAVVDNVPAGVVRLWPHFTHDRRAEFTWLHVDPDFQRRGIGQALVGRAIGLSNDDPAVDEIGIWVVVGNSRAISFWEQQGWQRTGLIETRAGSGWSVDEAEFIRSAKPTA